MSRTTLRRLFLDGVILNGDQAVKDLARSIYRRRALVAMRAGSFRTKVFQDDAGV